LFELFKEIREMIKLGRIIPFSGMCLISKFFFGDSFMWIEISYEKILEIQFTDNYSIHSIKFLKTQISEN